MPHEIKLTAEAAKYVRLSASTLEKARVKGTGPAFIRIGARKVAYLTSDLDKWLHARRRTSTAGGR